MLIYEEYTTKGIDLVLDFCGFEDCKPKHAFGPAIRENYVLHYISSGTGTFHYKQHTYQLKQGDLFLLKPDELTYYEADDDNPWSYYWLGIGGTRANEYFNFSDINDTGIVYNDHSNSTDSIGKLIKSTIYQANTLPPHPKHKLALYSKIYLILYQLGQISPKQHDSETLERSTQLYLSCKHYINAHYGNELSIQRIADEFAINRSYLTEIFKKHHHLSPKEYLTEVRMKRAKQLLEQTTESIKAISYSVGYHDQLTFSKAYKVYWGESPNKTRQLYELKLNALTPSQTR